MYFLMSEVFPAPSGQHRSAIALVHRCTQPSWWDRYSSMRYQNTKQEHGLMSLQEEIRDFGSVLAGNKLLPFWTINILCFWNLNNMDVSELKEIFDPGSKITWWMWQWLHKDFMYPPWEICYQQRYLFKRIDLWYYIHVAEDALCGGE